MMHELQPGDPQLIGPYRLHGRLGAGGMGQVFLGRSAGGRPVAVKVVRAHLATDPEFRERFRREIAVARKVSGVYTSPVIDADVDGPTPWLATAYVDGPSLADAVSEHGPLSPTSVRALAAGLAEGLNAIHAAGVVHRDLKPANVLLADDGPRVIDFGISQAAEASALTRTGLVVGSPGFMSPEQAEGREVGPPSDVFSLGAVLAFAATGEGPFGSGSTPALVYRVVYSPPNLDRLPAEVRPLIERCLAKDPAQRPTAAQVLAEAGAARPGVAVTQLDVAATRTSLALPATPATMTAAALGPVQGGPSRRAAAPAVAAAGHRVDLRRAAGRVYVHRRRADQRLGADHGSAQVHTFGVWPHVHAGDRHAGHLRASDRHAGHLRASDRERIADRYGFADGHRDADRHHVRLPQPDRFGHSDGHHDHGRADRHAGHSGQPRAGDHHGDAVSGGRSRTAGRVLDPGQVHGRTSASGW